MLTERSSVSYLLLSMASVTLCIQPVTMRVHWKISLPCSKPCFQILIRNLTFKAQQGTCSNENVIASALKLQL